MARDSWLSFRVRNMEVWKVDPMQVHYNKIKHTDTGCFIDMQLPHQMKRVL